ncbi:putative S-adenosylmethionine-dependent methyltransferase/MSMEI_2290 [Methylophilaceae bacterium]|nr:putative S-adenosylmethionine-dependent methyltransferase/MSMEI_2290 [Methylophilaceae bacterium]
MSEGIECPLCGGNRAAILRKFEIRELASIWKQKVGFDPFLPTEKAGDLRKLLCVKCGLAYFSPKIIGDHALYGRLSKFAWYYPKNKWEFDQAIGLVKQYNPRSVLEVGCGAGEFLHRLVGCVDKVVGVDINERAIEVARSKGLNVTNQSLSNINDSFDMIFMFQVLEHLEFPGPFIVEVLTKLNPGGHLLLAVPNPNGYMKHVDVVFLDMPPHHNTCWPKESFDYLADAYRLEMVHYEVEPMNHEYLRALLFAQISQDRLWRGIKLVQKVVVMSLLPLLFLLRNSAECSGQTHFVVLQKRLESKGDSGSTRVI